MAVGLPGWCKLGGVGHTSRPGELRACSREHSSGPAERVKTHKWACRRCICEMGTELQGRQMM